MGIVLFYAFLLDLQKLLSKKCLSLLKFIKDNLSTTFHRLRSTVEKSGFYKLNL